MSLAALSQSIGFSSKAATRCAIGLLLLHIGLLGWAAVVNSPNLDEPAHLASGISHWTFGRFDLYRVNPPLVRMVAAAPILVTDAKTDWSGWVTGSPYARSEFHAGKRFVDLNGLNGFWYFTLARWTCIPFCLIGLWTVFVWARSLYGPAAGLLAMWLYCFCPNSIAWGASITPDAIGASLGVFAAYSFWTWLHKPNCGTMLQAGLSLGLAELAKGSWVILFALWPSIWIAHWLTFASRCRASAHLRLEGKSPKTEEIGSPSPIAAFPQLVGLLLIAVYVLNLGYGFEGSFKLLRNYSFVSKTLSGQDQPPAGANRFAGTWLGMVPIPFPENYVRGLDVQKGDFERGKWSYLCGEQKKGGWWYYYLVAFVVKSPVGSLLLIAAATFLAISCRRFRSSALDEWTMLLPAIALFVLVSSQTGFSRYFRYTLPAFPFIYIHASRIAIALSLRRPLLSFLILVCSLGAAVESLSIFPHSMSFFNQLVGGPLRGHNYLLDANIDWGQDLLALKRWYDEHPEARPFHLAYFGDMDISPEAAGITSQAVPGYLPDTQDVSDVELLGPRPGWFAVSVNHIQGYHHYESDRPQYTYFRYLKPAGRAGYSVFIFHVTPGDANRLEAELTSDSGKTQTK